MPARQQDVLGLDVAVHHPAGMRRCQRIGHVVEDPHRLAYGQLALLAQPVAQRRPRHVWHHVVEEARRLPGVVHGEDVGVLQVGGDGDLAQEPLGRRRQLRAHHLERHLAVVLQVLGEIHGGHPARAELPLDRVAVGQRRAQPVRLPAHPGAPFRRGLPRRPRCLL
jgi:hypothetical protein